MADTFLPLDVGVSTRFAKAMQLWRPLLPLAFLAGCSSSPATPSAADYTLEDGTGIAVRADGGFVLTADGRTLVATSEVASLTVKRYDEIVNSLFAMWSFERDGEMSEVLSKFERSSSGPEGVTINLSGKTAKGKIVASILKPKALY